MDLSGRNNLNNNYYPEEQEILIYNIHGQLVGRNLFEYNQLDKGLYLVKIQSGNAYKLYKIIK
jgi:hypothetical protein